MVLEISKLKEEIIEVNYYILDAIQRGDRESLLKHKIMLDNLIKIILKDK